jgi:hypothetical protein
MTRLAKYLLLSIVTILAGVIIVFSILQRNESTMVKNSGYTFRYPKTLMIQTEPSTLNMYANYTLRNPKIELGKNSSITISIPLQNNTLAYSLAAEIVPYTDPANITSVVLGNMHGQKITYEMKELDLGDIVRVTREAFVSRFPNSPLVLQYSRRNTDASLDADWDSIRTSIRN